MLAKLVRFLCECADDPKYRVPCFWGGFDLVDEAQVGVGCSLLVGLLAIQLDHPQPCFGQPALGMSAFWTHL